MTTINHQCVCLKEWFFENEEQLTFGFSCSFKCGVIICTIHAKVTSYVKNIFEFF